MSVMQNSPLEKTMLATIQYSCCTFQNLGKSVQHTERTGSRKRQTLQIKRTTHETGHERIIHSLAHFKTMYLYTYLSNTWLRWQEFRKISTYSAMIRWCFSRKDKIIFKNKWLKEIYCKNSEIQGRSLSCSLLSPLPNFLLLLPYFYNLFLILWRANENEL